eukprot:gnl/Spiro4/1168_TR616_c0_g1_i1.p1 gnl/Spiro4/1168_TR616_c0_g1~~gnl/Spiro4/1168_TR616_c0_g1_i1.p1  ORF type:complete len:518 (+),score=55.21 gnl/Spiro4/1168_TR616_c0_g1_i1:39-1592(+)
MSFNAFLVVAILGVAALSTLTIPGVRADCAGSPCSGCRPGPNMTCGCLHPSSNTSTCPGNPCSGGCDLTVECKCVGWQGDGSQPEHGPASAHCGAGMWGDWCEHYCPDACTSGCTVDAGRCVGYGGDSSQPDLGPASGHCSSGVWGDWCEHACPKTCLQASTCTTNSGRCVGYQGDPSQPDLGPASKHCARPVWGDFCQHDCPTTCFDMSTCTTDNGKCMGYSGNPKLPRSGPSRHCRAFYWGDTCEHKCSCKAAPDGSSTCAVDDGSCILEPPCPATCLSPTTAAAVTSTALDAFISRNRKRSGASESNSTADTCGAWIIWRKLQSLPGAVHQAFAYQPGWTPGQTPSLADNSGYYCCGDDYLSGQCEPCGSSAARAAAYNDNLNNQNNNNNSGVGAASASSSSSSVVNMGRVCRADPAADYSVLLTTAGLASLDPSEGQMTCWFLDPAKGQSLDCATLHAAEASAQQSWNSCANPSAPNYSLQDHNCRHYVMAVMTSYCQMLGPPVPGGPCSCMP